MLTPSSPPLSIGSNQTGVVSCWVDNSIMALLSPPLTCSCNVIPLSKLKSPSVENCTKFGSSVVSAFPEISADWSGFISFFTISGQYSFNQVDLVLACIACT